MDCIDFYNIFEKQEICKQFEDFITNFDFENKTQTRGLYIYGPPGSGKSFFVRQYLKKLNCDGVFYTSSDVRNKAMIQSIAKDNIGSSNVLDSFFGIQRQIVLVMDEIDNMNVGDKAGLSELIKLIRPKKTKKQKQELFANCPIICIGNCYEDKKIKELMKVCKIIKFNKIEETVMKKGIVHLFKNVSPTMFDQINNYVDGNFHRLKKIYNLHQSGYQLESHIFDTIFAKQIKNNSSRVVTKRLLCEKFKIADHNTLIKETDRTTTALLWHENVIDILEKITDKTKFRKIYLKILESFVQGDYFDRVTFQKQLWLFNKLTSLLKVMHGNFILNTCVDDNLRTLDDVRFTKILTRYSSEHSNYEFFQNLCNKLSLDRKDLINLIVHIKYNLQIVLSEEHEKLNDFVDLYDVSLLQLKRIYKLVEQYVNYVNCITDDEELEDF